MAIGNLLALIEAIVQGSEKNRSRRLYLKKYGISRDLFMISGQFTKVLTAKIFVEHSSVIINGCVFFLNSIGIVNVASLSQGSICPTTASQTAT